MATAPQLADEIRGEGEGGVEGENVVSGRFGKAGFQRAGEASAALGNHARAEFIGSLAGSIDRVPIDYDNLVGQLLAFEGSANAWQQDAQVVAFVDDGKDYGDVHDCVRRVVTESSCICEACEYGVAGYISRVVDSRAMAGRWRLRRCLARSRPGTRSYRPQFGR